MNQKFLALVLFCIIPVQAMAWPDSGDNSKSRKRKSPACETELLSMDTPKFPRGTADTDNFRNDLYRVLYLLPQGLYKLSNPKNGSELQLQVSVNQLNRASLLERSIDQIGPSISMSLYQEFKGVYQSEARYREKVIAEVDTTTGWAEWKSLNFSKNGFTICNGVTDYEPTGVGYSCFEFVYKRGRLDSIKVTARRDQQPFRLKFEQFYFVNRLP